MSEFEFGRSLAIGTSLPSGSPVCRLDPRTRLLITLLLMVGLAAARRPLGLLLGLVLVMALWAAARAPLMPVLRGWLSALPFLLILALLQLIFGMGGGGETLAQIGPLNITAASLWAGLALILRFSAYIAVIGLAVASLSTNEVTRALESLLRPLSLLRIPVTDFVMVVQVTLRFFPLMAQSAERIAKAQASRGADWRPAGWNLLQRARQVAPLIVPLFITSLRRAENVALAMDARAYGSLPSRTSMIVLQYRALDRVVIAAGFAITFLIIIL